MNLIFVIMYINDYNKHNMLMTTDNNRKNDNPNYNLISDFIDSKIKKSLLFIISFSLVISLFGGQSLSVDTSSYSFSSAYAQSPANVTLPTNNTGINVGQNVTGITAANNQSGVNFNIATIGDMGCLPESNKTVSNMVSRDPEVVLALGDLSYQDSSKCWIDLMKPLNNITKITLGNHEWPFPLMMQYAYQFNLSHPFYAFNINNVHVLSLGTEFAFDEKSPQFDFAEDDLQAASVDPLVDWIVVFFHKPMYTSDLQESNTALRNTYHPLFDEFGVDLVLQGHAHNYERSYPIEFNSESRREPIVSNTTYGNSTYLDPRGPIIATVGTGGFSIQNFDAGKAPFIEDQYLGYGILDVGFETNQTSTLLNATYYSNDGQIQDQFKIIKPSIYSLTGHPNKNVVVDPKYAKYDVTGLASPTEP